MVEAAGPSNQEGIYYQNTVAASYLVELLSLRPSPARESVVEVRVEAPTHVDDIVVTYADRHREYIQAKSSLRAFGDAWTQLWEGFAKQAQEQNFRADDRLVVSLGDRCALATTLREISDRSGTSQTESEWITRLSSGQRKTLSSVQKALPSGVSAFDLFRQIDIKVATLEDLDTDFRRVELGTASVIPTDLQSKLRDLVGGAARRRGTFWASTLRRLLESEFGIDLFEPRDWGLSAYRETLRHACRVEIPGKGASAPVEDLIVWPRAHLH